MRKALAVFASLGLFCCIFSTWAFSQSKGDSKISRLDRLRPVQTPVNLSPQKLKPVKIDAKRPMRNFVVGANSDGSGQLVLGQTGVPIYQNNPDSTFIYPLTPNIPIADDVQTICAGSSLSFLQLGVSGGGDGSGPGFTVNIQLFAGCPSSGAPAIPDTAFQIDLPDDGLWLASVDLESNPVSIPGSFWVSMSSPTPGAGWLVGGTPSIGSSQDRIDAEFPCVTIFGDIVLANLYADFWAVEGTCQEVYLAYKATSLSGYFVQMELDEFFADDIKPFTADLGIPFKLGRIRPGAAGLEGPFTMNLEVWTHDPKGGGGDEGGTPLAPVLGTQCTYSGGGQGTFEGGECEFATPIEIPTPQFWMAYDVEGNPAGPLLTGNFPSLGYSDDCFAIYGDPDPDIWSQCVWWFGGCPPTGTNPCATFHDEIFGAGQTPRGACCDLLAPGNGPDCQEAVAFAECGGRFALDQDCATAIFEPVCGVASCCLPDESCSDMSEEECQANNGLWQPGQFCGIGTQSCPPPACVTATNECDEVNFKQGGCNEPFCCAQVCATDDFCCAVIWDETCVALASQCPIPVNLIDECPGLQIPADGSVILDNRQATDRVNDPGYSCHNAGSGTQAYGSVWVNFVAVSPTAQLITCNSQAPADDSLLGVFTGNCGNLNEIGCSDDVATCMASDYGSVICLQNLTVGQTYVVQLGAWTQADRGPYVLDINSGGCGALPGDNCAAAIPTGDDILGFNTFGANTDGPPLPPECEEVGGLALGQDVWFDFTAPATGNTTVDLCVGTNYDSRIAIYSGFDCPQTTGNTLACNDDGCGAVGSPSIVTFPVVKGGEYKIRVGGFGSNMGNGIIRISTEPDGGGCNCPSGTVSFVSPADGTIDARQPHPVNNVNPLQGIQTFTVTGPEGAQACCWALCETEQHSSGANSISEVVANGANYTINLTRPLTPGAITRLAYKPSAGAPVVANFITHPANVNGDNASAPTDILKIIDSLNGVFVAPWGLASTDADRSGVANPSDILRVIDLLNGADQFDVWNNVPIPTGTCDP